MKQFVTSPYIIKKIKTKNELSTSIYSYLDNSNTMIDKESLAILEKCRNPVDYSELIEDHKKEKVNSLIFQDFLVAPDKMWKMHKLDTVDIEIGTYCNWKCSYCPRPAYPSISKVMELDIFDKILQRVRDYKHIQNISLSLYNEPSIDPYFLKRIELIRESGLQLLLFTNCTGLNTDILDYFETITESISSIVISLPSADENTFSKITGSHSYKHVVSILNHAIKRNLPVSLSVQGLSNEKIKNIQSLKEQFPGLEIGIWPTSDRCGAVKNEYYNNVNIQQPLLKGCRQICRTLIISVTGNCYLCCNDFFQKNYIGNILEQSIEEILESPTMQNIRKKIFGKEIAEPDFLCRQCDFMQSNIVLSRMFHSFL